MQFSVTGNLHELCVGQEECFIAVITFLNNVEHVKKLSKPSVE